MNLKVAATQFQLRAEPTFAAFESHVLQVIQACVDDGAEIVVLPELVTTGLLATHPLAQELTLADLDQAYRDVFPPYTDAFVAAMCSAAKRQQVTIVAGSTYRRTENGAYRNTAYVFHPDGRMEQQDKLHLIPQERSMGTEPGDQVLITEIRGVKAAVQICADIEFPEVARYLAKSGVTLFLVPSLTWNRRGAQRVRYGAHARSMENQVYVAVSTLIGSSGLPGDGAMHGTGHALVTMPLEKRFGDNAGVAASHPDDGTEGHIVADLDFDLLEESRRNPEPPGFRFRRDDLYAQLAAGENRD